MPLKLPQKQKQCAAEGAKAGFLLDVRMLPPWDHAGARAGGQALGRRVGTIIIALVNGTALKVRGRAWP